VQAQLNVPSLIVLQTGATDLRNVVDPAFLPGVLVAYNRALTRTWFTSVATAAVSIIRVAAIDWRISVKGKKIDVAAA
jgi:hypothetical protein